MSSLPAKGSSHVVRTGWRGTTHQTFAVTILLLLGMCSALRTDAATLRVAYCNGGEVPISVAVISAESGASELKVEGWWTFAVGTGFGRECPVLLVGSTYKTYHLIFGFHDLSGAMGFATNLSSKPPHVIARSDLWYCVNPKSAFGRVGSTAELRRCLADEMLAPASLEIRVDASNADRDQYIELKHRGQRLDRLSELQASCERAITNASIIKREDHCKCMARAVQNSQDAAAVAALRQSWSTANLARIMDYGTYHSSRRDCPQLDPSAPVVKEIAIVGQLPAGAYVFATRSGEEKLVVSLAQAMGQKNYPTIVRRSSTLPPQFELFLGPYTEVSHQAETLAELKRVGFNEAVTVDVR